MQYFTIKKGATSQIILINVYDSSSSTGAKLTGLVYNSAGITAYYYREGAGTGATAITLATATLGTYTSGGFIVVDGTNMPGTYELHLPTGVTATGADRVNVHLKGATNMVPVDIVIDLTDVDLRDSVRAGLTSLPNAAAGAAGGLPTDSTGKTSFNDIAATAIVSSGAITTSGGAVSTVTSVTNNVGINLGSITRPAGAIPEFGIIDNNTAVSAAATNIVLAAGTPLTADTAAGATVLAYGSTQGYWQARVITAYTGSTQTATVDAWDVTPSGTITYIVMGTPPASATSLPTVLLSPGTGTGQISLTSGAVTVGTNNDKTGYSLTATTGLGNQTANITGNLSGSVGSVTGAVGSVTGSVGSISGITFPTNFADLAITLTTGLVSVGTNNDKTGYSISGTKTTLDALNDIAATAIVSGGAITTAAGKVSNVGTVDTLTTYTGNTPQTGDAYARLATIAPVKNSAYSNFEFEMVLASDHVTPATGLSVTGQRSIDGGAFATVSGTITEVSNGIYQFDALAADTNGTVITWRFSAATADDTFVTFQTVT